MKRWLIVFSLSLAMLCGCSNTSQHSNSEITAEVTRDIFAMDTYMYLKAYGENAETALGIASERILSLEKTFSVTYENSDTWAINHADGKCVNVSTDTLEILNTAIDIGNKTNGALDITLYPILKAWGFTTDKFTIPSEKNLIELLKYVDYQKISIQNDTVQLDKKMQLDFGALAKGYTSDCVVEILKENEIESALVNLGGNVHALGVKPDGSPWKVAVKNPFSPNEELCILEISDKAVITSGNYERYFTDEDGNNYWHILDPEDGYPADNGLVSVTIIGESGIMCDALSTALFVMGTEYAIKFWKETGSFDMILVTEDSKLYYTKGLDDCFQNVSNMETEIISNE